MGIAGQGIIYRRPENTKGIQEEIEGNSKNSLRGR